MTMTNKRDRNVMSEKTNKTHLLLDRVPETADGINLSEEESSCLMR